MNENNRRRTDGRTGVSPSPTETRNRLAPGELVIVAKFHENSQVEWNGGTKEKKRRRMEQETKCKIWLRSEERTGTDEPENKY